jgi:hypothetical protein
MAVVVRGRAESEFLPAFSIYRMIEIGMPWRRHFLLFAGRNIRRHWIYRKAAKAAKGSQRI